VSYRNAIAGFQRRPRRSLSAELIGRPRLAFKFSIGRGQVIAGWNEAVATMEVGGKRTLIIPAVVGFGARGAGGVLPPNAT
jgi:FKBP-type peptidyl-prolyl isomerase-like protein